MSDCELLNRYATRGDRDALGDVVRRHIGFVYAAALRQTRDSHAAEDVTQAVFIVLARRAQSIRNDAALPAWLFSVTRFAAASARRLEQRRAYHERRAAEAAKPMNGPDESHNDLIAQLDDAIADLSESDRRGVLLSYFHNKTFREVGAALGISEEAARKRVSRAIDRMREFFARRGAGISGSTLASAMTAQAAIVAPPHLIAPAANVAMITQSFTSNAIVKGVGKMLLWSTLKPIAAAAAAIVVVSGVVVGQVASQHHDTPPAATQAAAHIESGQGQSVELGDGVRVEFLALAPTDSAEWHTPAGAAVPSNVVQELLSALAGAEIILTPPPTHRAIVRVTAPQDANVNVRVPGATASGAARGRDKPDGEQIFLVKFVAPNNGNTVDLEVSAATGEWQSIVVNDHLEGQFIGTWGTDKGGVAFTEMLESDGKPCIYVATELNAEPWRVVALDDTDNVLAIHNGNETSAGRLSTCRAVFNLERDRIRKLEVQTRPYNKFAACRNCTLDPKHPTQPKIETRK